MRKKKWRHVATFVSESGKREYSATYFCWRNMRSRCMSPAATSYAYYGAIGVRVCDRWQRSYDAFVDDMGYMPPGHTLDRIDPHGNYEPSNCRWVTRTENQRNQRRSNNVTWQGKTQHLIQWAEELGIPFETLRARVIRRKWDLDRAMTEKINRRDT